MTDATFRRDVHGQHGARPVTGDGTGGFAIGMYDGSETPVVVFVPRLQPGVYRGANDAQVSTTNIVADSYTTGQTNGAAYVEILGNDGRVVWGRFLGVACNQYDAKECAFFAFGRFSAAIETDELRCMTETVAPKLANCQEYRVTRYDPASNAHPAGEVCETAADCSAPYVDPFTRKSCGAAVCRRPSYGGHESTDGNGWCTCP